MTQWEHMFGNIAPTFGQLGERLCKIQTEEQALELWNAYIGYLERPDAELSGKTPEEVASSNIGYLMGYYGQEERERVYRLFPEATHPTMGEALAAGEVHARES